MKSSELMVGNWIKFPDCKPEKVYEISETHVNKERIEYAEEIPLTEEILLKLPEFSKSVFSEYTWNLRSPDSQFNLYYRDDMNRFVFRGLGMSVVYVDTLHHLQNLVYVNTGKQLEVNL